MKTVKLEITMKIAHEDRVPDALDLVAELIENGYETFVEPNLEWALTVEDEREGAA